MFSVVVGRKFILNQSLMLMLICVCVCTVIGLLGGSTGTPRSGCGDAVRTQ
jgi:hypothetical protein